MINIIKDILNKLNIDQRELAKYLKLTDGALSIRLNREPKENEIIEFKHFLIEKNCLLIEELKRVK